jgi:hypothetical protein
MGSVSKALDYPSQRRGLSYPPAPMLLDTCLIQHLEFVMDLLGETFVWPPNAERWIRRRYGTALGEDLIALGEIVAFLYPREGPPWAVSETSWDELSKIGGAKRQPSSRVVERRGRLLGGLGRPVPWDRRRRAVGKRAGRRP